MILKMFIPCCLFLVGGITGANAQERHNNKAQSMASLSSSITNGKNIYIRNCLPCHQADGFGIQRMNPPLAGTEYVSGEKSRLVKIVLKGFSEDVEIKGQYYSNVMPALDFLTDKEVADVLTYVRNSFGNKASRILPGEVKKIRNTK